MSEPTLQEADRALSPREVGARLAQGPWQQLGRGLWAVPAVAYMSLVLMADIVLRRREDGRWVVDKAASRAETYDDPDLALYGSRRGLG